MLVTGHDYTALAESFVARQANFYQPLFSLSSATLIRSFPTYGCHWLTKIVYRELSSVFFSTPLLSPSFVQAQLLNLH